MNQNDCFFVFWRQKTKLKNLFKPKSLSFSFSLGQQIFSYLLCLVRTFVSNFKLNTLENKYYQQKFYQNFDPPAFPLTYVRVARSVACNIHFLNRKQIVIEQYRKLLNSLVSWRILISRSIKKGRLGCFNLPFSFILLKLEFSN